MKIIVIVIGVICLIVRGLGIPTGQIDLGWIGLGFVFAGALLVP